MPTAAATAVEVLRAVDEARASRGLSKAELARRGRVRSETVRHLLTDSKPNPTLSNVLDMLRPLGLGLALVPLPSPPSEVSHHVVQGWLAHYGAALYGAKVAPADVPPPETALAEAMSLARQSATIARALPSAFWKARRLLDFHRLLEEARRRGRARELGFFLDLTAKLSGDPAFEAAAGKLRVRPLHRPVQFFRPTTARERQLAELRTPEVARKWGFRMNMDMDSFVSMFAKGER
jgi:transcriptional regulator with XRE-family HTH domain